jgi:Na+/H+-dicarboxylate symporter
MNHGLAYGIVASVLAIIAGLLTGFLFRPKADEAH